MYGKRNFISGTCSQPAKLIRIDLNKTPNTPPSTRQLQSKIGTPNNSNNSKTPQQSKTPQSKSPKSNALSSGIKNQKSNDTAHKSKNKIRTELFYNSKFQSDNKSNIDETHGLVEWHEDNQFGVVPLTDVRNASNMDLEVDAVYDVQYGRELYKATLKIIGTFSYCNEQLKLITEYNNVSITTTNKKKISQRIDLSTNDLKAELDILKKTLEERDALIKNKEIEIEQLNVQLDEQRSLNQSFQETFSIDMKDKFIAMSKQFIQIFGCENDLNDLEFTGENGQTYTFLSSKYPEVKVSKQFRTEIDILTNNPKNSASMVFRRVIQTLIPDEDIWFNGNREKLFTEQGTIVYAAFDYVASVKPTFSFSECKSLIRQLCNESRRKVKRKTMQTSNDTSMDAVDTSYGDLSVNENAAEGDDDSLVFSCGSESDGDLAGCESNNED